MNVVVHYPKNKDTQDKFAVQAARFHAEHIEIFIKHLNCPMEQKLELIDAIISDLNRAS